jgi:hypothetical protein
MRPLESHAIAMGFCTSGSLANTVHLKPSGMAMPRAACSAGMSGSVDRSEL